MTNEQNFKKGDRVTITTDKNRIVGTITNVGRKYYHITLDNGRKTMTAKENVEPYDRRTAFLRRLGALLREFDAEIIAHIGEDDKTHADKPLMYIQIGDEVVNYENELDHCEITADNIMDFDKE